jgi:DNA-binding transcriptional MerR regulator
MMKIVKADIDAANSNSVQADSSDGYARIGELAKEYGVTLRDGTTRLYARRDVARLKLILLGRKVGFSLREVKQMLDLYDPGGSNTKQLKLALDKSEKQLVRLEKQRAEMDDAISELSNMISTMRTQLAERQPAKVASS